VPDNEHFPALMQELVLAPAGMTHSTFEQPLPTAPARAR
jgi:CubicO group peptidase (beta-lactamase class C family)